MSAWPLWSCPLMFWGTCLLLHTIQICCLLSKLHWNKGRFEAYGCSQPFLYTFCTSSLPRALLTGLTSNPHINDLHLDISGCEVSIQSSVVSAPGVKFKHKLKEKFSIVMLWNVSHCKPVTKEILVCECVEKVCNYCKKKCLNETWKTVKVWVQSPSGRWSLKLTVPTLWVTPVTHKQTHISHRNTFWPWFASEVTSAIRKLFTLYSSMLFLCKSVTYNYRQKCINNSYLCSKQHCWKYFNHLLK